MAHPCGHLEMSDGCLHGNLSDPLHGSCEGHRLGKNEGHRIQNHGRSPRPAARREVSYLLDLLLEMDPGTSKKFKQSCMFHSMNQMSDHGQNNYDNVVFTTLSGGNRSS